MLLQAITISSLISLAAAGAVRCFCNLPGCVTSGYMCKSQLGACFTLLDHMGVDRASHGCLELLHAERQSECQNEPGASVGRQSALLLCCSSDMCNHVDVPEVRTRGGGAPSSETRAVSTARADTEVWFKAATIAVPICGALILLMLIGLAVRLLRRDERYLPTKSEAACLHPSSKKPSDLTRQHAPECCSRPHMSHHHHLLVLDEKMSHIAHV